MHPRQQRRRQRRRDGRERRWSRWRVRRAAAQVDRPAAAQVDRLAAAQVDRAAAAPVDRQAAAPVDRRAAAAVDRQAAAPVDLAADPRAAARVALAAAEALAARQGRHRRWHGSGGGSGTCTDTWTNYAASAFATNCVSCHSHNHSDLSSYSTVHGELSSIKSRINSGSMPEGGWAVAADKSAHPRVDRPAGARNDPLQRCSRWGLSGTTRSIPCSLPTFASIRRVIRRAPLPRPRSLRLRSTSICSAIREREKIDPQAPGAAKSDADAPLPAHRAPGLGLRALRADDRHHRDRTAQLRRSRFRGPQHRPLRDGAQRLRHLD